MLKRIYLPLLFLTWTVLMGRLVFRQYFRPSQGSQFVSLDTGIRNIPSDSEWMLITQNGNRLGYSVNSIQNLEADGYMIDNRSQMQVAIAGMDAGLLLESRVMADTLFRLQSFEVRVVSDLYSTRIIGVKQGNVLNVVNIHGSDSTSHRIEVPDELYSSEGIQSLISHQGIREGETILLPALDPMNLEIDEIRITHLGRETIQVGASDYHLNKLEIEFKGIPSYIWLDNDGMTYREEAIMGMVMERTRPEIALKQSTDSGSFDLLGAYAIPVDHIIENPSHLEHMTIQITGLPPEYLLALDSPAQKVISRSPLQVSINTGAYPQALADSARYLASNEFLQVDHPRIRNRVRTILNGENRPPEMVRKIGRWVYNYLRKWPVVNFASAVEILDNQEGDCSEHTILFSSLSRAAGIPTRVNIGVVYQDGRFLYHAWPSVHIEGNWLSIDPTFGQEIADATHLVFLESDFMNLADLIPVLGQVQLQILDQTAGAWND